MQTRLVVGTFTPSVLLRVAHRVGALAEHGIAVDEVSVSSSPTQFRSLLNGELHAVFTNPDNVVAYRFCPDNPLGETADVRIVSAVDRGLGLGLYARTPMSTEELRAATWAVDVPTSGFAFVMYALAESLGIERQDYAVLALGSTPKRLSALLAGTCDVTMLNAGNELHAEAAGCQNLVRAVDVCAPYLGTVLAVSGEENVEAVRRLAHSLTQTTVQILSGVLDDETRDEASAALGLETWMAERYVATMKDPREGLVGDGVVDHSALATVVELRRRYLPGAVDGVDVLADALEERRGLLVY
ncbi:MAG: hypothetical protein QOE97_3041 [Pseudonocardiales bacterium]|nr:hypothetical protein [Pseudonocardiales bacterium]